MAANFHGKGFATEGSYDGKIVMVKAIQNNVIWRYKQLREFGFVADEDHRILRIHTIVKSGKKVFLISEMPDGTLGGFIRQFRNDCFDAGLAGSHGMSKKLCDIIMRIVKTFLVLKDKNFYINELNAEGVFLCLKGDFSPLVELLHGIKGGQPKTVSSNQLEVEFAKLLSQLIDEIFRIGKVRPSVDVQSLISWLNKLKTGIKWNEFIRHPALLGYWQKMKLLQDTKFHSKYGELDNIGFQWPNEQLITNLANHTSIYHSYDLSKFSDFTRLVYHKTTHFRDGSSITANIKAFCHEETMFLRFIEKSCSELWILLTDVLANVTNPPMCKFGNYRADGTFEGI